jgi:hypothetical protein
MSGFSPFEYHRLSSGIMTVSSSENVIVPIFDEISVASKLFTTVSGSLE